MRKLEVQELIRYQSETGNFISSFWSRISQYSNNVQLMQLLLNVTAPTNLSYWGPIKTTLKLKINHFLIAKQLLIDIQGEKFNLVTSM